MGVRLVITMICPLSSFHERLRDIKRQKILIEVVSPYVYAGMKTDNVYMLGLILFSRWSIEVSGLIFLFWR